MRILTLLTIVVCAALQTLCAQSASQSAGSAAPIGVYNVVPELPGMGRPVDTAAVAARRRALARRIGRGSILVPASHERNIEQDYVQDNDFRQNNTFFYLTELETQDAWLLLTARGPDTLETVLLLPPRTPSRERWTGLRLGPDSVARRLSGIATVLPIDSLDNRLRRVQFAASRGAPVYVPLGPSTRDVRIRARSGAGGWVPPQWRRPPRLSVDRRQRPQLHDAALRRQSPPHREPRSGRHRCRRGMGPVHRRCDPYLPDQRPLHAAAEGDLRSGAGRAAGGVRLGAAGRHHRAAGRHRAGVYARAFGHAVR